MSLLQNKTISIKILNVQRLSWGISSVYVAPRPYHALALRLKGEAKFTHEDATIHSPTGSITYMPADCAYYAEYSEANEIIVIHFVSDARMDLENFNVFSSVSITPLFEDAFSIWKNGKESYYYKVMSLYYQILFQISSQINTIHGSDLYSNFLHSVEYMKNHFTDSELSIESLVKIAKISNTYYRKLFVEYFGETPAKYLNFLRLQHAENMLLSGKHSIEHVAYASGFNDTKYFCRLVKNRYGCPPSQLYRKTKAHD